MQVLKRYLETTYLWANSPEIGEVQELTKKEWILVLVVELRAAVMVK